MKTLQLYITKKEITTACKKDSKHCMIADAVRAKYPDAQYIKVDVQAIQFSIPKKQKRYKFLTPPRAQKAIVSFDRGEIVTPFHLQCTEGIEKPMGWKKNHPNSPSRKGRRYNKTGKKRVVAQRHREFGLRSLS